MLSEGGTFREIESEGGLVSSKVIDMKDKVFRQILLGPPDNPTNTSINKPILVPTNIDALHQWKTEVPFQLWVKEWCNKPTTSCVYMNWCVPPACMTKYMYI